MLIIVPIITIIFLLVEKKQRRLELTTVVSSAVSCILGAVIVGMVVSQHQYNMLPLLSIKALGAIVLGVVVITSLVATCHSVGYLREEQKKKMIGLNSIKQYFLLLQVFLFCMYLAILTTNPIIMWIAIEATTLSTVFLISFFNRKEDVEAAWKYLLINSVGLLLALLGAMIFLSQSHSSEGLVTWTSLMHIGNNNNDLLIKFAFIFIMIGYGTKMGFVPMHTWRPDAYNKAPLPIVALLSGALLNVAFFAILQYKVIVDSAVGSPFSQSLFLFFGIISLLVPAAIMYTQTNFKRLLAYSSIEHAGIILLGFGFGGLGIMAALLHMVYHAFAKSSLFLLSSSVAAKYSSSEIKHIRDMLHTLPRTSILYIVGFLAIVGLPPFGIFFTEWYIMLAGFTHHPVIAVIAIIALLIVFASMLRPLFTMVFGKPTEPVKSGEFSLWTVLPVAILTAVLLIISIYIPDFLQTLLREASSVYTKTY